jgi:4-methylaminobutanoate oxidase (formaldehyde-forming)
MLWPTPTLINLGKYSNQLYAELEEETGQATGYRRTGSLSVARTEERLEELLRLASVLGGFGVECEMVTIERLAELYPGINTEGVLGAMYMTADGQTNPIDTTMALIKGARKYGARVLENTLVEEILVEHGTAVGVRTSTGEIRADQVVLTGGLWSRDLASKIGVQLPLYACEHFYAVTEPVPGLTKRPILRDFDKGVYFKEDAGKYLFGWFEHNANGCPMSRISPDFCFDEFPCDLDHIEPYLMAGIDSVPQLGEVGINTFFNGPESFTIDNLHLLGPTPEVNNFWVACGLNSKGIGGGGGLGKIMADWIMDGYPSQDILECDVRRHQMAQRSQAYIEARIPEALGHTYAMHWPFYQYTTARNTVLSPLHETLKAAQACFGEVGGYERPNWFARNGAKPEYVYSYKRQNWFDFSAAEHRAVREAVGMYDVSSFGKFQVSGNDALATLQRLSCADIDVPVGTLVYTQWLNERGGIEADLTIARQAESEFFVMTGIASTYRDSWHLRKHLIGDTQAEEVSAHYACLALQGPQARAVLEQVADCDVSDTAFAFATGQFAQVAGAKIWLQRISYTGELGWELFIPAADAVKVYQALWQAGQKYGLCNVGLHAVNSLRLEKGFRHWGHDIGPADSLQQAGLAFTAKPETKDFIGREAFLNNKAAGIPERRLVQFRLHDPEPLLYHYEPIVMDGQMVGYLSSGMYGHTLGSAIGMGYVNGPDLTADKLRNSQFEIEIARKRFSAEASLQGFYDPSGTRMRT